MANKTTMRKAGKIAAIIVAVYIGQVVLFESLLGYFQPENANTVAITVFNEEGDSHQRILALLRSNNAMYVAVNHWPRSWYRQARSNPNVEVTMESSTGPYTAVFVDSEMEYDRVQGDNPLGFTFRFLTGFPPRHFFRLDPR